MGGLLPRCASATPGAICDRLYWGRPVPLALSHTGRFPRNSTSPANVPCMPGDSRMRDAAYFIAQAQRCRRLLKRAVDPESIEQLQTWAREFEEKAAETEQRRVTGLDASRGR